jgi:phospholipid/cholesterol/gamma-HCH transport system substrate-binding protein
VGELIDDVRARVFPLIDEVTTTVGLIGDLIRSLLDPDGNLQTALARLQAVTGDLQAGQGTIGRLLTDDTLMLSLETSVGLVNQRIAELQPVLADVNRITTSVGTASEDLPALVAGLDRSLATLDETLREMATLTDPVGRAVTSAGRAADALPAVLVRLAQTLAQLEELLDALRRSWLIGGGVTPAPGPEDVRP